MVQILPPKYNIGTQVGQSLGQGLQAGMQQGLQRGMLQKALGKVKGLSNQVDAEGNPVPVKPIDLITGFMEATAGIPGSEKYLSTLLPMLLGQQQAQSLYGQGGQGQGAGQGAMPQVSPAEASREAGKFVAGEEPSGILAHPMSPDEMQSYAEKYALTLNDPKAYGEGFNQAERINAARNASRQSLITNAEAQGITPQEMPRLLQKATEFQDLKNLPAIERAAVDATKQIRNQKDALKSVNAPGAYQKHGGVLQHVVPGMTLIKALTSKGADRQKYLKGYDELVGNLVKEGEEPYVRETLAEMGLSPTEIEERIHPLTDQISKQIKSLPKGNQLNPKIRNENLVDFFRKNVGNNTSLSVLRHYLVEDQKYDWQEIQKAVQQAFPNGDNLTKYQQAEMANLAQPPIQSLSQIFGPTPNLRGFLRGQR